MDGLSIIGTSAETFSSASPDQLEEAKTNLARVIENDFSRKNRFCDWWKWVKFSKNYDVNLPIIKIGNWIGPLLVDAA